MGLTARCYPEIMKRQMQEAGFINVHARLYKQPIAPWPKDQRLRSAGRYFLAGFEEGLSGMSVRVFTKGLDWSVEEMELLLMQVRNECRQRSMHGYIPMYVTSLPVISGCTLMSTDSSCTDRNHR